LPHIARKLTSQIHKTALGAESLVPWEHDENIEVLVRQLQSDGYTVIALEQGVESVSLHKFVVPAKVALLLGREVEGIDTELLKACDIMIEIPMFGQKESFNVVQASAMALYHLRFSSAM
jgi:tRNA G18 (ribose-2'-O)-methylase SpoU